MPASNAPESALVALLFLIVVRKNRVTLHCYFAFRTRSVSEMFVSARVLRGDAMSVAAEEFFDQLAAWSRRGEDDDVESYLNVCYSEHGRVRTPLQEYFHRYEHFK